MLAYYTSIIHTIIIMYGICSCSAPQFRALHPVCQLVCLLRQFMSSTSLISSCKNECISLWLGASRPALLASSSSSFQESGRAQKYGATVALRGCVIIGSVGIWMRDYVTEKYSRLRDYVRHRERRENNSCVLVTISGVNTQSKSNLETK